MSTDHPELREDHDGDVDGDGYCLILLYSKDNFLHAAITASGPPNSSHTLPVVGDKKLQVSVASDCQPSAVYTDNESKKLWCTVYPEGRSNEVYISQIHEHLATGPIYPVGGTPPWQCSVTSLPIVMANNVPSIIFYNKIHNAVPTSMGMTQCSNEYNPAKWLDQDLIHGDLSKIPFYNYVQVFKPESSGLKYCYLVHDPNWNSGPSTLGFSTISVDDISGMFANDGSKKPWQRFRLQLKAHADIFVGMLGLNKQVLLYYREDYYLQKSSIHEVLIEVHEDGYPKTLEDGETIRITDEVISTGWTISRDMAFLPILFYGYIWIFPNGVSAICRDVKSKACDPTSWATGSLSGVPVSETDRRIYTPVRVPSSFVT